MIFYLIVTLVILQRLTEVVIAKRNEKWMIAQGAYEVGNSHYPYMVTMHISFFLFLIVEVVTNHNGISPLFPLFFILFVAVQALRIWCIRSLGTFWNTKILILPHAQVVRKGPYEIMRHPNYAVVCLEILLLPLMFQAYFTAFCFTLLNITMLSVRIPIEEKALRDATNYNRVFEKKISES
ncbi:isoprenylcysteine carboxyl methyltransferase family protein [Lysinibacillus sp. FSL M8-0216]|uniref:15-methylpalmitoyl-4-hydroxy-2-pyrone 4-O-methyltransferase n=1 Tax=Lysinibacillus fusiformis TaxID=28031 RepID=A0A1H9F455_9BACI|nr:MULTISPECIES: isoprenylcysteine carboxyl methyltransferase family protein [Lysinibacillus]HAU32964.1 isoprenylcysteine carboxyl methyltransferase [Lysinibacillus sp.]MCG7436232.1 isoprenylcysteine carboxyl methyltransferase family protein [Lysinibacillus fusiformis]MED4669268.1 isoprenylcysteine carboxyl methyltransferase family protein [Lysinibacillus fusiformis]NOG29557.1 isoprenylcysteine carboxyl methyltransferase family protein [Lysinibacillus fusiformis]QAS57765.1 isoprenylcysteine ca